MTGGRPQASVLDRILALAERLETDPLTIRTRLRSEGLGHDVPLSPVLEVIVRTVASEFRSELELEAGDPGPAEGTREQAEALIKRACDILARLDEHGPVDLEEMHLDPDHLTVLAALRDSLRPYADEPVEPPMPGQFAEISFFGHTSHTGYVTEITMHGAQPGYRIDLPELIWGGNQSAYREYAASAMFSRWPVDEASVLARWRADRERAEQRRQREEAWAAERELALSVGTGECSCDVSDDGTSYGPDPACPVHPGAPF